MRTPQTFVVRVLPGDPDAPNGQAGSDATASWMGRVTHVSSGDTATFASFEQLVAFVIGHLAAAPPAQAPAQPDDGGAGACAGSGGD